MKKIVEMAHDYLKEVLKKESISVDFTCGQGFDTLFLAQNSQQVFAYDIQKEAIDQTKKILEENHCNNVVLLHKSHEYINEDVLSFDAGIFNCGYLPHGEPTITTNGATIIQTLQKALALLTSKGRIVLVLYPGFVSGKEESEQVENYCIQLPSKQYDVGKIEMLNRKNCPYIIVIDKH